jgi:hypothetical protein
MSKHFAESPPIGRKVTSRNALLSIIALAAGLIVFACSKEPKEGETAPMRDINIVMTEHTGELMAIQGVTGVAIGETDDGIPCVLVLVEQELPEVVIKIPKSIEGHPVRLLVSGIIVPMDRT